MSAPTGVSTYTSGGTNSMRESLSDVIQNIAPVRTPYYSGLSKESVSQRYHEWLEDTLEAAASNAQVEGKDPTYADYVLPSRRANYSQILRHDFAVTDTFEAVDKAGRKSEVKYQLARHMKMLARDVEYALHNASYSAGTASAARQMRSTLGAAVASAEGWLNNPTYYGTGCYYNYGSTTPGTANTLDEERFNTMIQAAWVNGGDVTMVLTDPKVKRVISKFNNANVVQPSIDASDKKMVASIDVYESDFGTVKIVPEQFFYTHTASGETYYRLAILDMNLWALGELRPFKSEKLARTGPATKYMIEGEITLISKATSGNALIENIYA